MCFSLQINILPSRNFAICIDGISVYYLWELLTSILKKPEKNYGVTSNRNFTKPV